MSSSKILILSSSLRSSSKSRILAEEAERVLRQDGHEVALLDLRDYPLPFCDGADAYDDPNVAKLEKQIAAANAVIVAVPIYNYDVNAAVKNVVELTGSAWENKVVSFLCAAGGMSSYMSVMSFANGLMLDFRSIVAPRFVYATSEAFDERTIADPEISRRVTELARETARLGRLLAAA